MITINKLKISNDLKNIEVNVSSDNSTARFTNVFVWTPSTFRDYSKIIDVSDLLSKQSNNEAFSIPSERFSKNFIDGIYFMEFRTDEDPTPLDNNIVNNQMLGVVANLFSYKECLLNKTLSLDIKNCKEVKSDCNKCKENTCLINTLIEGLETSLIQGFYEEASKIAKELDKLCNTCNNCPDYENTLSYNGVGLGYQVVNNEVVLNSSTSSRPDNGCNQPELPPLTLQFMPVYIKQHFCTITEGQNYCEECLQTDICYENIAYIYRDATVGRYDGYNVLYTQPILDDNYLYQPVDNRPTRFQISKNPFRTGPINEPDLISLVPELGTNRIRFDYNCCNCETITPIEY